MSKKLDLDNNNKKVTFPDGSHSLNGIEFNKRVDPNWRKKFNKLSQELERAKGHTQYCVKMSQRCEVEFDKSTDSIQRAKWKQEMDYWHMKLCEARHDLAKISKDYSEGVKIS